MAPSLLTGVWQVWHGQDPSPELGQQVSVPKSADPAILRLSLTLAAPTGAQEGWIQMFLSLRGLAAAPRRHISTSPASRYPAQGSRPLVRGTLSGLADGMGIA